MTHDMMRDLDRFPAVAQPLRNAVMKRLEHEWPGRQYTAPALDKAFLEVLDRINYRSPADAPNDDLMVIITLKTRSELKVK